MAHRFGSRTVSMYGEVVFYGTKKSSDPKASLLQILEATGVEHVLDAWRTLEADRTWDFIQQNLRAIGDEVYAQEREHFSVRGLGLAGVALLYRDDRFLSIDVGPTEKRFGSRVWRAVRDGIPEEIRGKFEPAAMYVGAGYHDITGVTEEDEDVYIARAFFSVEFFGYGVPRQWKETRRRIFQLPEIVAIKGELEEILGPLEGYADWSV